MLGDHVDDQDEEVLIALNVAPMQRGPLLDFSIQGPLGDAWLLPRMEIAVREAGYLEAVSARAQIEISEPVRNLIVHILGFAETGWQYGDQSFSLADYLKDGLGGEVSSEALEDWTAINTSCRRLLRPYLDVAGSYSVCESPALAVPNLFPTDEGLEFDESVATLTLRGYRRLLQEMHAQSDVSPHAFEFLRALADYGNYYDLVAAMKVPLDEPFLVKYSERRSLAMRPFNNEGKQSLIIADAQSNHVTFKVIDPNVRIREFTALEPTEAEYAYGTFPSRSDDQTRSFYAHDSDRDYRIILRFRLALLRRLQIVPYLGSFLITLLAVVLVGDPTKDIRTLGLVVGPTALAASVLLAREPSTLGSRLRLVSTMLLSVALMLLVGAAVVSYLRATMCV